jgi:sulfide dehydrogenase [flavocytochrome c] flavoprotein subunit
MHAVSTGSRPHAAGSDSGARPSGLREGRRSRKVTRRAFLGAAVGLGLAGGLSGCAATVKGDLAPKNGRRVVVVGGGWGGATAARYIRMTDPSIEVVLLEPNYDFVSCPFSNLVLSGLRSIESLTRSYDGLRGHGVRIIHEAATAIEPDTKRVRIGEGYLAYDRLVVSPGIDFEWDQVEGLPAARDRVLHAWKAGPQTVELARQIQSMADGSVFILTVPPAAYRCPPAPYERICQVAWYLKQKQPKSRIIVLDANEDIVSETALFRTAWQAYPNIDYRASRKVIAVDASAREVRTDVDRIRYDVLNLIPAQRAGAIAVQADLVGADRRWCEVDHVTYESARHRGIHVIGDATVGLPVPKSGHVANAMGKAAALGIVSLLNGQAVPLMPPGNACYSWVSDREAIAVVNAYKIENNKVVQIEQRLTPAPSVSVAQRAEGWRQSIWADMLS